jgi:hypothetical protein
MGFNAKQASGGGGKQQDAIAIGNYPARLVQIIEYGLQEQRPYKGKEKAPIEMLRCVYELPTELCVDEDGEPDAEKPRWIGEEFPFFNLGAERAKSTQRYMALDPELMQEGDWEALAGGPCTLTVVHNTSGDKTYANIGSTAPPMKGFDVPDLVNPITVWSLDDPDMEEFEKFPEFIQDKIKANLNFKGSLLETRLDGNYVPQDEPVVEGADADAEGNPYG